MKTGPPAPSRRQFPALRLFHFGATIHLSMQAPTFKFTGTIGKVQIDLKPASEGLTPMGPKPGTGKD
jgi:hypothetical protein